MSPSGHRVHKRSPHEKTSTLPCSNNARLQTFSAYQSSHSAVSADTAFAQVTRNVARASPQPGKRQWVHAHRTVPCGQRPQSAMLKEPGTNTRRVFAGSVSGVARKKRVRSCKEATREWMFRASGRGSRVQRRPISS